MENESCLFTQTIRIWRSWERSTKTISSRTGKMRRSGSASSNSCPPIIQRLGSLPLTSSGTWSAMQILRTHGRWHSSQILTPALTSFYFPFRLPREDQFPDLVRSLEDLGDDYGTCFIPIRRYASISSNFVRGLRSSIARWRL